MKYIQSFIEWLDKYQGISQWLTFFVALTALIYSVNEFFLKRRPYIDIEMQVAENPNKELGGWLFFGLLTNKGTYPGIVKINKTIMTIGDETYPSSVNNRLIISPGEGKKSALIGTVYVKGIQKILNHEYRKNRIEIEIEVLSASIGEKKLKFKTKATYQVHVDGDKPIITLIEEDFS